MGGGNHRTFTLIALREPTRVLSRSCSTQQLDLQRQAIADLVQQQRPLPRLQTSRAVPAAPVKAPFSWPNSSAGEASVSAAVNGQKRLLATGAVMMEIAGHHPLPVPVSPTISTVASVGASLSSRLWKAFDAGSISAGAVEGFWVQHSGPPIVDALNLSCGGRRNQRKARGCCKCASGCAAAARLQQRRGEAVFSALILKD